MHEDCRTEVMQRSVAKGYVTAGRTATISIVWEDRTLDFEIEEVRMFCDYDYVLCLHLIIYATTLTTHVMHYRSPGRRCSTLCRSW